jgi:hypothetical protein
MPVTNAAKELYRLAMMDGHATQDFSAIYEYLANNDGRLPNKSVNKTTQRQQEAA